jgi:hypothetical protein
MLLARGASNPKAKAPPLLAASRSWREGFSTQSDEGREPRPAAPAGRATIDALSIAHGERSLGPEDLETLASALFLVGHYRCHSSV